MKVTTYLDYALARAGMEEEAVAMELAEWLLDSGQQ